MERVATVRVLYADTDAGGVVYYANYLRWFEVGRAELMRRLGVEYHALTQRGILLPVTEVAARYGAPARYDDTIHVHAEVRSLGRASISFAYRIERDDGAALVSGHTVHAFVDGGMKVVPVPDEVRKRIGTEKTTGTKGR